MNSFDLGKEDFDKFKCSLCDDHLKTRYDDLKKQLWKIFKHYLQLMSKIRKNNTEDLVKWELELQLILKEYVVQKSILDKMINFRKEHKMLDFKDSMKIRFEDISENEKSEFFSQLERRKSLLLNFKKNLIELEDLEIKIEQILDEIGFVNQS